MKKPSKTITVLLEQHFKDDRENFSKIEGQSKRFEVLLGQMGEHLSFLRRDMNIITETQKQHAEESTEFRKTIIRGLEEIKMSTDPLVKEDREEKAFHIQISKYAEVAYSIFKGISAFSAALAIIWAVFKYIIFRAIQ